MPFLRRLMTDLVAKVDRIADQEADPAALTGRSGRRRHGLPVVPGAPTATIRDPTPEEAQRTLDEVRADQHRRMRGGRGSKDARSKDG